MFIMRSSCRSLRHLWLHHLVFLLVLIISYADAVTKKAVIEWSPNGPSFRDPMPDHAALVELHPLDRVIFICDSSTPAVIYRVSEKSFDECKYELSAEWIGECSAGTKYIPITLRSTSYLPIQPIYNVDSTYFFTSFSSGTRLGLRDKSGALCLMGVRLILEVRRPSKRVPLLPRSSPSEPEQTQVPVQRVSYGGTSETSRKNLELSTEVSTKRDFSLNPNKETSEEVDFWSGWPWNHHSSQQDLQSHDRLPTRFTVLNGFDWDPSSLDYFNYSSAYAPSACIFSAGVMVLLVILGDAD